ncbi:hypothetical protein F5883DRAFT_593232 [Diaporthe sp. PMI_573]|nr:hypothetical protein F5883DRAFT_593232 [Diaporthaceae sp. PMI_573]
MSREGRLRRALRLKKDDKLFLDGPHGQDPQLRQYEIVVRVAKGLGIAGVLSAALSLVERRQHDLKAKDQAPRDPNTRLFRDRRRHGLLRSICRPLRPAPLPSVNKWPKVLN